MVTHSSILDWRILWTEEVGGLWYIVLQRVGHATHTDIYIHIIIYYIRNVYIYTHGVCMLSRSVVSNSLRPHRL